MFDDDDDDDDTSMPGSSINDVKFWGEGVTLFWRCVLLGGSWEKYCDFTLHT